MKLQILKKNWQSILKGILCVGSVLAFLASVYDIGSWDNAWYFVPIVVLLCSLSFYREPTDKKNIMARLISWIPVVVVVFGTSYFSIHLRPGLVWMGGVNAQKKGKIEKARTLWIKGAKRGYARSQVSVGGLYEKEGNLSEARTWYEKAAMQGDQSGEWGARRTLIKETAKKTKHLCKKTEAESRKELIERAKQGDAWAMYYLAEMREEECDIMGSVFWLLQYYSTVFKNDSSVDQDMLFDHVSNVLNSGLYDRLLQFRAVECSEGLDRYRVALSVFSPNPTKRGFIMNPEVKPAHLRKFYLFLLERMGEPKSNG